MAGRPKKTTTKSTVTKVDDVKTVEANDTELMIKELQEQLAMLIAENKNLKAQATMEEQEEITSDTEIAVVSQTVGKLIISTEGNGMGTVYRFDKFGEVQDIPFGDLKEIVKNKPRFAREGAYYIANEQAVKKLRLTNQYKDIIDDKTLGNLFDMDSEIIISLYNDAPKMQKEQIVSMIEEKINKNEEVDGNVLIKVGKLCGKNFLTNEE